MSRILLSFVLIISLSAFAQQEDALVYFNAKQNAQYYYDNPLKMLNQRALDRRSKQNIALDSKDIPISQSYISQVAAVTDIKVMAKSKWMNALHIRGSVTAIKSLTALPFVEKVVFADKSLNSGTVNKISGQNELKQVNKTLETKANYNYGGSANQIQMLKGHLLHQQNFTGNGKIIAVLDAGFSGADTITVLKKIRDNKQILGGYNFVARNNNIYSSHMHGTAVLSTMGGFSENKLIGTAPEASYYLFITEDSAAENPVEESLWVEAAEKADSLGVDVINTSLGYFQYDNPKYNYTYSDLNGKTAYISRGADIAFSRGMFLVTSAGNSGNTADVNINVPADSFNTLTVGAVNSAGQQAGFSSIGNTSDGRVKPDVMAQGEASVVADASGKIVTMNGTSFSSPITAGLVTCLWQALPDYTNAQLLQLIKQSSSLYATPTVYMGYGIPNFSLAFANALSAEDFLQKPIALYPNPVSDKLFLTMSDEFSKGILFIYSALGQMTLIKELSAGSETIDLENLDSGTYFYKILTEAGIQTGKILKK